jgi:phosphopantothenoylcysteine decarboxylase/phosphopantothenate--cysteine ligase
MLKEGGAVVDAAPSAGPPRAASVDGPRVVLALSGGVVAAHAPALTEMLLARGFQVRTTATPSALRFVSALALEALTHEPVVRARELDELGELAHWAQLVVVYPATAATLSRIARGECSSVVSVLSALAISAHVPVILAPAMNEAMWDAPAVQRNLQALRGDGFIVMHPSLGYEVAVAPSERGLAFGAAPTVQTVALVAEAVLRLP